MRSIVAWCVAASVAVTGSQAHAAWNEAKSKHFIIYANQAPRELRDYAEKLERFDQAVRYIRGMPDPDLTDAERLTIFVLPDTDSVGQLYGNLRVAGFYVSRDSGSYAFVPQRSGVTMTQGDVGGTGTVRTKFTSDVVFFHEYAHHLQLQNSSLAMPAWVSEGFAEFFATAQVRDNGSVEIGRNPAYRSETMVAGHLPVATMVGTNLDGVTDFYGDTLYARGWLLTHYLTMTPSRKGQLTRYLDDIQKGEPLMDAAKAAFGDLSALDRELDRYKMQVRLLGFTVNASVIPIQPVATRPLGPGETAMMRVVMRSKRGVDDGSANNVAADATKIAAAYPNDPMVQASLAEALCDAKQYAAADAAADRALAADPKNVHALIYKGRAQMGLAHSDPAHADWDKIRNWFTSANKLDTENAEPMALFYRSFLEAGQSPTQNAIDGMLYAVELAPQDDALRTNATRLLLALNRLQEAKEMFAPIAYNPHAEKPQQAKNAKVMAALIAGDAKTAMSVMDSSSPTQGQKGK